MKNNGGPVYPQVNHYHSNENVKVHVFAGISRRDDLAKAAMIGELSCQSENDGIWGKPYDELARKCYGVADAMIREGAKD